MGIKLTKKFQGIEGEVVKAVQELGIDDAMLAYGVRNRKTFINWLRDHTGDNWKALNPLEGLEGGYKAKLMRDHRDTILDEIEIFGKDWVMLTWGIAREDTLERFISFDNQPFINRLTPLERAKLDSKEALRIAREVKQQVDTFVDRFGIIEEGRRAETHTVIELQEAYANFTDSVSNQLAQGIGQFFKVMLEQGIKVDTKLPPPAERPDLNTEDLLLGCRKAELEHGIIKSSPENPLLWTVAKTEARKHT